MDKKFKKLYDDKILPPNWYKKISKSKKSIYYYNKATGRSQWTIPTLDSSSTLPIDTITNNSSIVPSYKNENLKISNTSLKAMPKSSAAPANKTQTNKTPAQGRLALLQAQLEIAKKLKQEKINRVINRDKKKINKPFKDVTKSKLRKNYNENNNSSEKKYKIPSIQNSIINGSNFLNNVTEVKNTDIKKIGKKVKVVNDKNKSITTSFTKDLQKLNDQISDNSIETAAIFNCPSIPISSSSSLPLLPTSNSNTNYNIRSNFSIQQNLNKTCKIEKFSANNRLNNFRKSIELNQQNSNLANNCYNNSILNADINNNSNYEIEDVVMTDSCGMLSEGDESMDWEDLPDIILLQEVNKIRADEFEMEKATELMNLTNNNNNNNNYEQNYNELSSMYRNEIYIIIDTNILLKTNGIFKQLELIINNILKVQNSIIIIPYMVLNELDRLKCDTSQSLAKLARIAVRYLNEKFQNGYERIKGQSVLEHSKKYIDIYNADDNILNCCIQFKCSNKNAILLTNDVNLRNKALSSSIQSFSYENFIEKFKN